MHRLIAFILLTTFLVSCGASIDPALQSKINSYFGKSPSQSFSGSTKFTKPMAYKVGQYVVYGVTREGKRSISKNAIVGSESNGWIIETHSITETNESIVQMLVQGLERAVESNNMDDLDIVWVKTRDKEGTIQSVEGPVLLLTKGLYKKALVGFTVNVSSTLDGGSVSVPAGNFAMTTKIRSSVSLFGSTYESDGWYHSAIPVHGLVKSISTDGEMSMELLEFGLSGASKSF